MKRLIIIPLLLCMLLFSCDKREYSIMSYQDKGLVAQCTVNDKYDLTIEKLEESYKLTVNKPEKLQGITFEIGSDIARATYNDVCIEIDKSHLAGICAIANTFSLEEVSLTSAKEKGSQSILSFENDYGTYQVTLGENSMPQKITIQSPCYTYKIVVNAIEIKD